MADGNPFIADHRYIKFLDSLLSGPSFDSSELRFYPQMFAVFVAIEGLSGGGKDTVSDELTITRYLGFNAQ